MTTLEGSVMFRERKGPAAPDVTYLYHEGSGQFVPVTATEEKTAGGQSRVRAWVKDVFLPQGYPHSVSSDYLHYQMWDTMQAYCSSIGGALSLQATLTGLGVGEGSATPLAATLTWLLKDGAGMVASIAFAYWKGSQLDCNSKQWRLFADVANDLGLLLRLLGPLLPVPFLLVMCVSAVMMALVGVAGGATRASLTLHQARRDNMADVSAKDGSQETLVNLAALITSLTILPFITASFVATWVTFLLCVVLHLLANYQAVRAVQMVSLNRPRLLHILRCWVLAATVPGVEETNLAEPLFHGPAFNSKYFPYGFSTSLGGSLNTVLRCSTGSEETMQTLYSTTVETFKDKKFMICGNLRHKQLHIVYKPDITPQQELEAVFMAYLCVLNFVHLTQQDVALPGEFAVKGLTASSSSTQIIAAVKQLAQHTFLDFWQQLQAKGWQPNKLLLAADEWRLN